MLVRIAGVLRALASFFRIIQNTLVVLAELIENLGINSDIDTLIWLLLLFCLVTRRFVLLFTIVGVIVLTSPVWYVVTLAGFQEYEE